MGKFIKIIKLLMKFSALCILATVAVATNQDSFLR